MTESTPPDNGGGTDGEKQRDEERHNWRGAESVQRLVEILVRDKEDFKEKKEKSLSLRITDDDKRRDSLTANNGALVRKC